MKGIEFYLNFGDLIDIGAYYEVMDDDIDVYDVFIETLGKRFPCPYEIFRVVEGDLHKAAQEAHRAYLEDSAEVMREIDDYYRRDRRAI